MTTRSVLNRSLAWGRAAWGTDWREGLVRDSFTVFLGQFARMALGLVSSALLARSLGPAGLSLFSVTGAAMMIGLTIADLGLSHSAVRQIAADRDSHPEQAQRSAAAFSRYKVLAAAFFAAAAVLLAQPLAHLLHLPPAPGPFLVRLAAIGLLATAVSGVAATLLQSLRRFPAMVASQMANVALTVLLMAALFLAGRLTVASALMVGALTAVAGAILGYALLPGQWRRAALGASSGLNTAEGGRLLAFSRWLWLSAILSILSSQLDLLLLNRWLPAVQVGYYALALNLAFKVDVLNQTLHTVLLPAVSTVSGGQGYRLYLGRSLARSLALALVLLLALPLVGPFVLAVYGAEYAPSLPLFYLLMGVILFDLLVAPLLLLAFPMEMPRLIAASDAVRVTLLLAVGTLLIPATGANGAVIAKLAAKAGGALVIGAAILIRLHRTKRDPSAPAPDTDTPPVPLPTAPT